MHKNLHRRKTFGATPSFIQALKCLFVLFSFLEMGGEAKYINENPPPPQNTGIKVGCGLRSGIHFAMSSPDLCSGILI